MDIDDFKHLLNDKLDDKLNPIVMAITRLERQQERTTEILSDQKVIMADLQNLKIQYSTAIERNDETHDDLFNRIRECEMSEGNKLWDVVKIMAAGIFGGIVAWLAGNR